MADQDRMGTMANQSHADTEPASMVFPARLAGPSPLGEGALASREGTIKEKKAEGRVPLVDYPSSPPPLAEGSPAVELEDYEDVFVGTATDLTIDQVNGLGAMIQEHGGYETFVSYVRSVGSLTKRVGGLPALEELVSDTPLLQIAVDEVGGLEGLYNLIFEAEALRKQRKEHLELHGEVNGALGLAAKADKFDKIMEAISCKSDKFMQAINEVDSASTHGNINAARAGLLAFAPLPNDPNLDLYGATPLVSKRKLFSKTGSNNVPLGRRRELGQFTLQHPRPSLKREPSVDLSTHVPKRPRGDVGRVSSLLQASLYGSDLDCPPYYTGAESWRAHSQDTSAIPRTMSSYMDDRSVENPQQDGFGGAPEISRSPVVKVEDSHEDSHVIREYGAVTGPETDEEGSPRVANISRWLY